VHDRLAVHELLNRWWFAYDEGQFEAWPDMLTDDIRFTSRTDTGNHPHEEFIASDNQGKEPVLAWQREHRLGSPYPLRHNAANIHITGENGDEVDFSSYLFVTTTNDDGQVVPLAGGIVTGTARRVGDGYRLAVVHTVLDTLKPTTLAERRAG
jgi:3-phenylpropionate/cinnamic acid dioxygenase small subunit